jgi:hypothetical protein
MTLHRIWRISAVTVIAYFICFTAACWFLDLTFPGKLATQTRARIAFDAGVLSGSFAALCAATMWRSHRLLAALGFSACFLWIVWECLPRL